MSRTSTAPSSADFWMRSDETHLSRAIAHSPHKDAAVSSRPPLVQRVISRTKTRASRASSRSPETSLGGISDALMWRQCHRDAGTWGVVGDGEASSVDFDDVIDDGESEADAAGVACACIIEPCEAFKHADPVGYGDSGSVVGDGEFRLPTNCPHRDRDPGRGVAGRIVEKVSNRSGQERGVADHLAGVYVSSVDDAVGAFAQEFGFVVDEVVEVDGFLAVLGSCVDPGEGQKVIDQVGEPHTFLGERTGSAVVLDRVGDLELGPDRGDRAA